MVCAALAAVCVVLCFGCSGQAGGQTGTQAQDAVQESASEEAVAADEGIESGLWYIEYNKDKLGNVLHDADEHLCMDFVFQGYDADFGCDFTPVAIRGVVRIGRIDSGDDREGIIEIALLQREDMRDINIRELGTLESYTSVGLDKYYTGDALRISDGSIIEFYDDAYDLMFDDLANEPNAVGIDLLVLTADEGELTGYISIPHANFTEAWEEYEAVLAADEEKIAAEDEALRERLKTIDPSVSDAKEALGRLVKAGGFKDVDPYDLAVLQWSAKEYLAQTIDEYDRLNTAEIKELLPHTYGLASLGHSDTRPSLEEIKSDSHHYSLETTICYFDEMCTEYGTRYNCSYHTRYTTNTHDLHIKKARIDISGYLSVTPGLYTCENCMVYKITEGYYLLLAENEDGQNTLDDYDSNLRLMYRCDSIGDPIYPLD